MGEEKKAKAQVDQEKAKVKQTKDAKNVAKAQVAKKTEEKGKAEEECDDAEKAEGKGANKAKKIVQMAESGIAFWEAKLRTVPALLKTKTDVQSMLPILRDEHKWKEKIEELKNAEK